MTFKPFKQLDSLESRWEPLLSSPLWYLSVIPEVQEFMKALRRWPAEVQGSIKEQLYGFFERRLIEGTIALGASEDADTERKPIDTIVIHHTSNPPGLRSSRLSAIELIRLYGPYFANPTYKQDRHLKYQAIYSGHVRNGAQVFWPYHWIVRRNGRAERLLCDSEIGWHAGNWNINCRSVAIVVDGDFENTRPFDVELEAVATIINRRYGSVPLSRVIGHREVNPKTTCPSEIFLDGLGRKGWKRDLLVFVREGQMQRRRAA